MCSRTSGSRQMLQCSGPAAACRGSWASQSTLYTEHDRTARVAAPELWLHEDVADLQAGMCGGCGTVT